MAPNRSEAHLDQPQGEGHYLVSRLRAALAEDPRTAELGIRVSVSDDAVSLAGQVESEERRRALAEVATELIAAASPGRRLRNVVEVIELDDGPSEPERI
ncbi:MAG: BON domain-containing protein [Candidatus Dormibacteraceae bacterium]